MAGTPAGTMFEGGHFTLAARAGVGEPVPTPDAGAACALTTDTTRRCFAIAVDAARAARARGERAGIGLMVGDLALASRPRGGAWAIPPSYRAVLADAGLAETDVVVWGEAYARNQGKRRLLDAARALDPRETYTRQGWALFAGGDGAVHLASDASIEWGDDARGAVLARGATPLCPLVFAGLKRAVFQAGWAAHVAVYALADDPWIDVKLRAGAVAVAQLRGGRVGMQEDWLIAADAAPRARRWAADELVAPGERAWDAFVAEVAHAHPGLTPLEDTWRASPTPPCGATSATSRCSG
ncbi:MAG: hypothetical protein ACOZNI_12440 [Myxococcota bacterium]